MRISDWSSDVCSSDLNGTLAVLQRRQIQHPLCRCSDAAERAQQLICTTLSKSAIGKLLVAPVCLSWDAVLMPLVMPAQLTRIRSCLWAARRSEAHKSELQSLMRTSYAVF